MFLISETNWITAELLNKKRLEVFNLSHMQIQCCMRACALKDVTKEGNEKKTDL